MNCLVTGPYLIYQIWENAKSSNSKTSSIYCNCRINNFVIIPKVNALRSSLEGMSSGKKSKKTRTGSSSSSSTAFTGSLSLGSSYVDEKSSSLATLKPVEDPEVFLTIFF